MGIVTADEDGELNEGDGEETMIERLHKPSPILPASSCICLFRSLRFVPV